MKGNNQFNPNHLIKNHKGTSFNGCDCVFISYSRKDKAQARDVASMIKDRGIDIYFDENDQALQIADEASNHQKVVECIEGGIAHASLLLGIITENTKDSWWVPYEIGSANGRRTPHAHLITQEVRSLPSYIQASTILPSINSLDDWLSTCLTDRQVKLNLLQERINGLLKENYKSASAGPVPKERSVADLVFY